MKKRPGLFEELKRRNVFRVAIAYGVSAWLLAQVADLVLESFAAPQWAMRVLLIALAVGFPIALALSWAFEVTPGGVVPESRMQRNRAVANPGSKRLDRIIILVLAIIIVFMIVERMTEKGPERFSPPASAEDATAADEQQVLTPVPAEGKRALAPSEKSVAVLPFVVMSTGPDDDYFTDGLTEEIIAALSQLPDLLVTARTSAFHFKGQNLPIGDIAHQLGVANVLEGSVRRAGGQLRITAQLIRADDGFHLWSETYDRRTEDTFAVQQDIAEKVATALDVLLDEPRRQSMQQAGLRNVEAFIAFQKAMEMFEKAHIEGTEISLLRQANAQFEEVSRLVPDYGEAYLRHADLYAHFLLSSASGELDGNITDDDVASAADFLRSDYDAAVKYAPDTSQRLALEVDRNLLLGEWRGLSSLNERALESAGCRIALWAQLVSAPYGAARPMKKALERVATCDPVLLYPQVHLAMTFLWSGEPQAAQQIAQHTLRSQEHHTLVRAEAEALAAQGEFSAAEQVITTRVLPEDDRLYLSSLLASMQGEGQRAGNYLYDYLARHGPDDQTSLILEAARGNRNEANRLAALIDGRPFGYVVLLHAVYNCLCGAPFDLESTPVFAGMLAESGLPWPPEKPLNLPLKDW